MRPRRTASLAALAWIAITATGCSVSGKEIVSQLRPDDRSALPAAGDGPVVVASDTASDEDPIPFWGSVDCDVDDQPVQRSGASVIERGGDPAPRADDSAQGDSSFRRLTAFDGDDFYGERCELGLNDDEGPVAFYEEGERLVTFASFRLPDNYPLDTQDWQGVLQIKQAQTADNADGTPVLSISGFRGEWSLWHSGPGYTEEDFELWATPARRGEWTRMALDVTFSQEKSAGRVKLYVDRNGDGSFDGPWEQSPEFRTNTLKREDGNDTEDGFAAGDSLPSHLRVGLYHNEVIPCPAPAGCSVDVDNVQVVELPSAEARFPGLD